MSPGDRGSYLDLGARWDGRGTTLGLWAPAADAVDVCLFDDDGGEDRIPLTDRHDEVWYGRLPGVRPGQRYGLRLSGPDRFPHRLLVDPYALAIEGAVGAAGALAGQDTAAFVPRGVVVDTAYDWQGDRAPDVPWADTVLYEAHVRGLTRCHPNLPPALRGTYAGLAHPAVIQHMVGLGVTSVELLPVHHFDSELRLQRLGLSNFWGYNTLGFFAPHGPYAADRTPGGQVREFKDMVRALHSAGLEVILDVVYNHTVEGDHEGPTVSWRGIDDAAYYRHQQHEWWRYDDVTGCGNTLQTSRLPGLRMTLDSLRYWVQEMHVDGFRFDLAPALARSAAGYDAASPFLSAVGQDPALRSIKLIAEPWDVGMDGYQLGQFPVGWSEWNDRFRNGVRDAWRGHHDGVRELAGRLAGSSDLYRVHRRGPTASVNFVTSHDGFTLRDLVSYNDKHNADNLEDNRDGDGENRSWNCGAEGPAGPEIETLRRRQSRNLLTTLLLSAGVPMLLAGDEMRRTQQGNNNAYCQDSELSWVDWSVLAGGDPAARNLRDWVTALLAVRSRTPALRPEEHLDGMLLPELDGARNLAWFGPAGTQVSESDWNDHGLRTLGLHLDGRTAKAVARGGDGTSVLLWLHLGADDIEVTLPGRPWALRYDVVLDTASEHPVPGVSGLAPGGRLSVTGRSAILLRGHH
ncbi:MAG: glycogen debranching protein GlgX [Geodermatophilaceae bacterium]|nr:glycogen debranching protein GlgX [Geodermatophilaceae bacterium]